MCVAEPWAEPLGRPDRDVPDEAIRPNIDGDWATWIAEADKKEPAGAAS
jgi:hypothetical protein